MHCIKQVATILYHAPDNRFLDNKTKRKAARTYSRLVFEPGELRLRQMSC